MSLKIVVVGGGTAGWITAGVLASRFPERGATGVSVTLIEAPGLPPIGVGEGTWPTIRSTLKQIGVSESDFLRECDASFKQGTEFRGWLDGGAQDRYYHPFTLPIAYEERNLAPYWLDGKRTSSFASSLCFQSQLCEDGRAPKLITTPEYAGLANYAYHLDAGKFAPFLQRHCVGKLGVAHFYDEIVGVQSHESGDISSLALKSGQTLSADLYIDCSGFAALLIGKHFGVPFKAVNESLYIDRAWAVQTPYPSDDAPIASITRSTALKNGWVWDIGLTSRRGVGYVFSSNHTSEESALEELKGYLAAGGDLAPSLSYRMIKINSGYREEYWRSNCVAVGLSAGFLEPLEASAIVMIELSAKSIANLLPGCREGMQRAAQLFNETFRYRWERIVDFLKLHYVLSRRTDSQFWIDNRTQKSIPESLQENLEFWQHHSPWHEDFTHREEVFSAASYQYVLYGMGFEGHEPSALLNERDRALAAEKMLECVRHSAALSASLAGNRELLGKIKRFGLQTL
jgi:tryptophan 7-halogenase